MKYCLPIRKYLRYVAKNLKKTIEDAAEKQEKACKSAMQISKQNRSLNDFAKYFLTP